MHSYLKMPAFICAVLLQAFATTVSADVWDTLGSHAEETQMNENVEEYVWKEGDSDLPDYPQEKNLLAVAGPPAYRKYQYLIDARSLTVGPDGVVRYSLVIRSPSGADNVMYDGIRCNRDQIKNYAYGITDMDGKKKFIKKQSIQWKPLRGTGATGYGPIFVRNYFCDHYGAVLTRKEIIQNIKYGKGNMDGLYN